MPTVMELSEKKATEAAKLGRMDERAHAANLALEDAERDLEQVTKRVKEEEEEALLNEQKYSTATGEKAIREAGAKVAAARKELASARAVVMKQSDICAGIESQIHARRYEAFVQDLAPAERELVSAMVAFTKAAAAVNEIGRRHGASVAALGEALFPPADPRDRLQDYLFRGGLASLVNTALAVRQHLCSYERVPDWAKRYVA
jgi:hypothetical protein